MIAVTSAEVTSAAAPEAFFARWADTDTWPEWNTDTAWVRLDGPFVTGATGRLKPKAGPAVGFVLTSVVPGREFVDTSPLPGARLVFAHTVRPGPDGGSAVRVDVSLHAALARVWNALLGKGLRTSCQPDLERLSAAAQTVDRRGWAAPTSRRPRPTNRQRPAPASCSGGSPTDGRPPSGWR